MDTTVPAEADTTANITTSPSQLQEVTLGANETADQTKISPMRGRSVKEYDEQITGLKKENFNLKLRIYFLEERMGPTYRLEDKDNIVRKNIEYQVELESLRKELEDKQELLCQAVKAMELEETEHKKNLFKKELQISELTEKLEAVQKDTTALTEMNNLLVQKQNRLMEDSTAVYNEAFNLQDINNKTQLEIDHLKQQISDLETQLAEERDHSAVLEEKLQENETLDKKYQNVESELKERDCKLQNLLLDLEEKNQNTSQLNLKLRTLNDELKHVKDEIEIRENISINQEKMLKDQLNELENLKKKLSELIAINNKDKKQIESLRSSILTRDNNIADLENKLERCKDVIRNLEAKLEKFAHEKKRKEEELNTMKLERRTKNFNENKSNNWLSNNEQSNKSSTSEYKVIDDFAEVRTLKDALKKKEDQHRNACSMIQSFIMSKKILEKKNFDLKQTLEQRDKKIIEMQKELKKSILNTNCDNSKAEPHHNQQDFESSTSENPIEISSEDIKETQNVKAELEKQIQNLMEEMNLKEQQLQMYEDQFESVISTLKNKDNHITELEEEIELLKKVLKETTEKLEQYEQKYVNKDENGRPLTWTRVTEEKDKKIEQLETEVRKHTYNLQGIVNTELWEKNREIEKLQNRITDKVKVKDEEISKLEKELIGKEMQLKILKDKIEELGIHVNLPSSLISATYDETSEFPEEMNVLKEKLKFTVEKSKYLQKTVEDLTQQLRNTPERESENKILQLKSDYMSLQQEYEKSEKCRVEMGNICVLLTTRLEELAHFLDSLLKHKSVLGLLGMKQHSAIKQAIDQSLDLSKSFNISLIGEDKSLAQLSSISGFLNTSQPSSLNLSILDSYVNDIDRKSLNKSTCSLFNSRLSEQNNEIKPSLSVINEQNDMINNLQEQIEILKKKLDTREIEIKNLTEKSLDNDNEFVEVLMDLQSKSPNKKNVEVLSPNKIYQNLIDNVKTYSPVKHLSENNSESETWSEPDRDVSHARMGLDTEALKTKTLSRTKSKTSVDGFSTPSSEGRSSSLNKTPTKRSSGNLDPRIINTLQENINLLENKLKEKDNELLVLQCKLMDNDNKLKENQLKVYTDLEKVRKEKSEIEITLNEKIKIIDILEKKLLETESNYKEMKKSSEDIQKIMNEKEKQIDILEKLLKENNINTQNKLQENDDKWINKIKEMESEAELRIQEIRIATKELKDKYESEWVEKTEMNKHMEKMKLVHNELENLKELLKATELREKQAAKEEMELNKRLQEQERQSRETIIALKRELNEYALRTSQAVLERTKVNNEKLKLEQELRRIEMREKENSVEFAEKEKQYINIKNNIQKQLSHLELQKSNLQLKVTELETTNVELNNRIIRLQNGDITTQTWPKSTPTSPIKIDSFPTMHFGKHSLGTRLTYHGQRNDISGYNSEDHMADDDGILNRSAPEAYHWFNHANLNISIDERNIANSSPDLGIESDPGRFSSLETNVTNRPLLQTLELTASMNNLLSDNHNDTTGLSCNIPAHKTLKKQNDELQKTVSRLESGLEKTMAQLSLINKNKKQVEKAVCKQIHKTSIVLRQARANLDSGSESEVLRK